MKITVEFDNEAEFEAFRTSGKKTRSKKDDAGSADEVPNPILPPAGGTAQGFGGGPAAGFGGAQTGQLAGPTGGAFGAANAQQQVGTTLAGPSPAVVALVQRIIKRTNETIAGGHPAEQVLAWFRNQCGPETAAYTMEQIAQSALPRMSEAQLNDIAKQIAA